MDREQILRDNAKQLEKESLIGDKFFDFVEGGWLELLDEYVFRPLDREAFELFKKVPAEDANGIIESQMMSKVVDLIKGRIQTRIHQGQNAKAALIESGKEHDG